MNQLILNQLNVKHLVPAGLMAGVLGLCLLSVGCAVENNSVSNNLTARYHFVENGCDTGVHEFKSTSPEDLQRQLCTALQSESTNNGGCALDSRMRHFEANCPGRVFTRAQ